MSQILELIRQSFMDLVEKDSNWVDHINCIGNGQAPLCAAYAWIKLNQELEINFTKKFR